MHTEERPGTTERPTATARPVTTELPTATRAHRWHVVMHAVLAVYLVFAGLLLFTGGRPDHLGKGLNLVPFKTIANTLEHGNANAVDLLGLNFALLVPLGAVLALSTYIRRHIAALAIILGVSIAIEVIQYLLPIARSTDVDDVILYVSGGFTAYAVCAGIGTWRRRAR